ncbi:hypothetical protein SAMN05421644_1659 [Allochromatium warmingii]|uniref:Uncharacterized protein n=1 Tax=Allochromatium warmingii TaxID=61595 RepID=A0A1H3JU24_ALLWA|nr:hypothetical protein SAMN05421644_1659 [Allochromatium warmingii]
MSKVYVPLLGISIGLIIGLPWLVLVLVLGGAA